MVRLINTHLIFIIFFGIFHDVVLAQHVDNIAFVLSRDARSSGKRPPIKSNQARAKSELAYFGFFMLKGYQKFVSSQDKPVCIFSTSCSNFGRLAIEKKGFVIGVFLTADRLTRCNTQALHYYDIDPVNHRRIDPIVRNILLK